MHSEQPADDLYGTIDTPRSARWIKHPTKDSYSLSFGTATITIPRGPENTVKATVCVIENVDGIWMGKCEFTEDRTPKVKLIPLAILRETNSTLPPTPDLVDDRETASILRLIRKKLGLK